MTTKDDRGLIALLDRAERLAHVCDVLMRRAAEHPEDREASRMLDQALAKLEAANDELLFARYGEEVFAR